MKKVIALLLAFTLLLSACSGKESFYTAEPETDIATIEQTEPTEALEELECAGIDAMPWENAEVVDFSIRLLRESMKEGKNTLISPVSILAALSMTANGAAGETLAQMEAVLGQNVEALNEWYEESMGKDNDYLHLSNSLYIKDDPELTVQDSFVKTIERYYVGENYASDVMMTLFNEYTAEHINGYVEDRTDGMIKKVVDEIPDEAVMYLVNALAFEARWANPYNEHQVGEEVFTTEDGREQRVELMYSEEGHHVYIEKELYTGFLKNYEGGRYVFAALLPKEGITVAELADSLTAEAIYDLPGSGWHVDVLTALPKFQTEFDAPMGDILQTMGMSDAFDPNKADFSSLATYNGGNIYVNSVLHKSFIAVGEQGTRAGAATVVEMAASEAMAPEEVKEVILNRPFLYMILDTETNTPIFMGTFMDTQAEGTCVPMDELDIFYSPAEDPCMMEE